MKRIICAAFCFLILTAVGGMADLSDDFKTGMLVKDQRPEMLAAKLIFILELKKITSLYF